MLEKKIEELGQYFDGIVRLKNGLNGIKMTIPKNWVLYNKETENYVIQSKKISEEYNSVKALIGSNVNLKYTELMDFAIEIMYNNIERENKKELFQLKVVELGKIFDSNKLSTLENLVFKFDKNKKNRNNKNKQDEIIEDNNQENVDIDDADIENMIENAINEVNNK